MRGRQKLKNKLIYLLFLLRKGSVKLVDTMAVRTWYREICNSYHPCCWRCWLPLSAISKHKTRMDPITEMAELTALTTEIFRLHWVWFELAHHGDKPWPASGRRGAGDEDIPWNGDYGWFWLPSYRGISNQVQPSPCPSAIARHSWSVELEPLLENEYNDNSHGNIRQPRS